MDKYIKGILTVITVGIIAINVQMSNGGSFFAKPNASTHIQKVQICGSLGDCAYIYPGGELSTYQKNI